MHNSWLPKAMGLICTASLIAGCSGDSESGGTRESGGANPIGGASQSGSTGGKSTTGGTGTRSSGGSTTIGTPTSGGTTAASSLSVGGSGSGGLSGMGGTPGSEFGGAATSGGAPSSTGGAPGGASGASGGASAIGGETGAAGNASGGTSQDTSSGGSTVDAAGGVATGGSTADGTTGGVATGGSAPEATGGASTGGSTTEATGGAGTGGTAESTGGTTATGGTTGCSSAPDNCPDTEYCSPTGTCVQGCKENAACVSGSCDPTHSCLGCISDEECAGESYCSSGLCLGTCTTETSDLVCGSTATCCGDRCANTTLDISNCGGCGIQCTATQFCGSAGCTEATLSNVCDLGLAVGVLDGKADDEATKEVLAALTLCSVQTREVTQDSNEAVNGESGQPFVRGELLVAFGGDAYQRVVAYAESQRFAPIYPTYEDGYAQFRLSSNDQVIAQLAGTNEGHDLVLIEVARDPATGTPMLFGYGWEVAGTAAAAWYVANVMLPSINNFANSWYVFEWSSAADAGPRDGSEFTLLAGG